MIDATTERQSLAHAHVHAHDPASRASSGASADGRPIAAADAAQVRPGRRMSLLDASAGARLSAIFPIVALLWAGVYWALH
jgi:hypothetical protein